MIKIGAINIDVSHPFAFSQIVAKGDRARYTAVYNDGFRSQKELQAFAEKMGLTVCDSLEEMAQIVDIGFVHSCNWDKHLSYAMPFIAQNKPVFIDKPIVGNLQDLEKLRQLMENGAKILGTSALRYCKEVAQTNQKLQENNVMPLHTVTTVGVDEFNYAIHAVELICGIHRGKPLSCRHMAHTQIAERGCDNYLIRFDDGSTAQYITVDHKFAKFNTVVLGNGQFPTVDCCFEVDNTAFYQAMLDRVCDYMETGVNTLATCEQMCDAIRIMLAGKASLLNGDREVGLDDPVLLQTRFDGDAFEKEYAANAKEIYL